jgi:hypothetical protein
LQGLILHVASEQNDSRSNRARLRALTPAIRASVSTEWLSAMRSSTCVRVRVESSNGEAIDEVFAGEAAANIGNEFSAFCAMLARAVASVRTIN